MAQRESQNIRTNRLQIFVFKNTSNVNVFFSQEVVKTNPVG